MAIIILELDTDLDEDVNGVKDAVQAIANLIAHNSLVRVANPYTIANAAREVAETVTLDDKEHPEYGYQPVIRDIDQLAAFIDDGIRTYLGIPELGEYEPRSTVRADRFWAMRADAEDGHAQPFGEYTYGIVDEEEGGVILYVHQNNVQFTLDNLRK